MKLQYMIWSLLLFLFSCTKEDVKNPPDPGPPVDTLEPPVALTPYDILTPAHFPVLILPEDNMPYLEKILLGRKLYYDPILSNDGRSCSSCHQQSKGFTIDPLINNMPVLPHVNLGWNTHFMWNGSHRGTLEDVMLFEVKDFFQADLAKVNQDTAYRRLFRQYFGVREIGYRELAYALAQFVRTMISRDTKYDRFLKGIESLTYDEMQGRNLFFSEKGDCYHCHVNPVMTDNLFHNIGLDSLYQNDLDKGLYNVSLDNNDLGKFRTPNLRNVALRLHYMHDGRFRSLEEVVEFYNSGVKKVGNLDPIMTKPGKENGLKLTAHEKYQLIAFLHTLTDETFITDPEFSAP